MRRGRAIWSGWSPNNSIMIEDEICWVVNTLVPLLYHAVESCWSCEGLRGVHPVVNAQGFLTQAQVAIVIRKATTRQPQFRSDKPIYHERLL